MKIIVSEIPEEGMEIEVEEDASSEPIRLLSPLQATLKIDKRGLGVYVKGTLKSEVELQCSRCLKPFPLAVASNIDVVYNPAEEINREEHYELKGDELNTGFYREDQIDTNDLLIEQVLFNLPMKPLCSSQCKGICPKCGADLNVAPCNCELKEPDTRFDVLKQLLNRKE